MPAREEWRRYAAPAAFLLAATIAILLVRSGLQAGSTRRSAATTVTPTTVKKRVVTTTTTKTAKRATTSTAAGTRFWTVRAGDTFGVISSQTGVPVSTIEQLNPNVSPTSLFIGQKIRVG